MPTRTGGRLVIAIAASFLVVIAAPFVGQIRGAVQQLFPGQYRTIVAAMVVAAVAAAVVVALARLRRGRRSSARATRPALRYAALAAALVVGVIYARATSTGNPEVDAVERFHFVEYGLLAVLYYRVWHDRHDVTTFGLPLVAGFLVGTLDEAFQWFVPGRIGEMRDVLLNGVAIGCGLLFAVCLEPPGELTRFRDRGSRIALAGGAAVAVAAFAAFVHAVHLGFEVRDPEAGVFLSRFAGAELESAARDRAERWRTDPPSAGTRLTREDHYLSEGLWHVQRRNEAVTGGDLWAAWHENLILERFYPPVIGPYGLVPDSAWTSSTRADIAARAAGDPRPYTSDAHPYPIYLWDRRVFWTLVAAAIVTLAVSGSVFRAPSAQIARLSA